MHELTSHFTRLRLNGVSDTLEVRIEQAVRVSGAGRAPLPSRLAQGESERRAQKGLGRRVRRGQVNTAKTIEAFDFDFNPAIDRQRIRDG